MSETHREPPQILGPDGHPTNRSEVSVSKGVTVGWRTFVGLAGAVAIVAAFLTNMTTIFGGLFQSPDVSKAVREAAKAATSGADTASRVAGLSQLGGLWDKAGDADLNVIADTLTETLLSDSARVRKMAEEAIGRAYDESTSSSRRSKLRRLLYGSTGDWYPGVVIKLNWSLQSDPIQFSQQLVSTRQAIRKNWEDLRNTHMRSASLVGADLWESHLEGAYLLNADLRCADLRGASLSGADVTGVKWRYANVEAMTPERMQREALSNGAMKASKDQWKMPDECNALLAGRLTGQ